MDVYQISMLSHAWKSEKTWCAAVVACVIGMVTATASINYILDPYGIFRDPSGRILKVYVYKGVGERSYKYLLSYRYVPANFDGLLIGTSMLSNFDTSVITAARVYNLSVSGGNISEEKIMADKIFESRKPKLVIFSIFPYLTDIHGRKAPQMYPREYWGALGSIQITYLYISKFIVEHNLSKVCNNEFGVYDMDGHPPNSHPPAVAVRDKNVQQNAREHLEIDPIALSEYRALISSSRAHGARVLAFVPPINFDMYNHDRVAYDNYFRQFGSFFKPGEVIANFTDPEYHAYTKNQSSYIDGAHLTNKVAAHFSVLLNQAIQSAVQRGIGY